MKKGSIHINTVAHSPKGSALILVVVLTVLLAAVGVLFLMTSRIDEMATSGIVRTRELRAGVNVVLDRIRTVLTDDLFGGDNLMLNGDDPCALDEDEYWDYPGDDDSWLASLEPLVNDQGTPATGDDIYYWLHITDLYDDNFDVSGAFYEPQDPCYPVSSYGVITRIIADNEPVDEVVDDPSNPTVILPWGTRADADGDGVADSRWIVLPDITSSGGENIYAAIRIIDNCGMININTAYKFDPLSTDGSQLTDIDLKGITKEGSDPPTDPERDAAVDLLHDIRCGGNGTGIGVDMVTYNYEVVWRILNSEWGYLPFDIGDELELRNRFFIDSKVFIRPEIYWLQTFLPGYPNQLVIPYDNVGDLDIWFQKSSDGSSGYYNRRHISTTYSFDRVIVPWSNEVANMPFSLLEDPNTINWYDWTNWDRSPDQWTYRPICINDYGQLGGPSIEQIAAAIWLGLPDDPATLNSILQFTGLGWTDEQIRERLACQMAVNLADFIDLDSPETVTSFTSNGVTYYGYESNNRHLSISMVAVSQYDSDTGNGPDNEETHYTIELYNSGQLSTPLNNWELDIGGATVTLPGVTVISPGQTFLIADFVNATTAFQAADQEVPSLSFLASDTIRLIYTATGIEDDVITISTIPDNTGFDNLEVYTAYRGDITFSGGVVARLRGGNLPVWDPSLGVWSLAIDNDLTDDSFTSVTLETTASIQGPITTGPLRTIGELSNVLALGTMDVGGTRYTMSELWENLCTNSGNNITDVAAGRIDLQDSRFANVFRYLTVFNPFNDGVDNDGNGYSDDPENDGEDNDGNGLVDGGDPCEIFTNYGEYTELAVAGRININTAPWFVMAQLPWMQYFTLTDPIPITDGYQRARAVFYDRITNGPFENIGDLMRVEEIRSLAGDIDSNLNSSIPPGPDFTDDAIDDDFEERDILFHRISNLITVRSDVFTAYILVRIGQNGPQKRMIAVFDRSRVFLPADRPKLVVLHPVPDPR